MSSRVYIGRLARDARERDLERLFKGYGEIREINVKTGYGFVEFRDSRDAEDVVYDFHGKEFQGERIIVELARGTRRTGRDGDRRDRNNNNRNDRKRSSYRLIVEGIPSGTSWQDLKDLMRKAGEVTFADVFKNRPGEGVVEFAHRADMKYALDKMNDSELNGERVQLFEDSNRRSSRRSRSPSDSRSPSPRRRSSRRRSRSMTPSRSRSRSRSPRRRSSGRRSRHSDDEDMRSPDRSRDRSRERSRDDHSRDRSREASRDRTPDERGRSYSRSPSRSPDRSPISDDDRD